MQMQFLCLFIFLFIYSKYKVKTEKLPEPEMSGSMLSFKEHRVAIPRLKRHYVTSSRYVNKPLIEIAEQGTHDAKQRKRALKSPRCGLMLCPQWNVLTSSRFQETSAPDGPCHNKTCDKLEIHPNAEQQMPIR